MDNRMLFSEISRLRTKELMISKMEKITEASFFRSLKIGFLSVAGILTSQLITSFYDANSFTTVDVITFLMMIYGVVGYLVFDKLHANVSAQIELICDLLALRLGRTGKRG